MMQDSRGIIWIWGDNGAMSYDGEQFTRYSTDNGLPDNYCYNIKENPDKSEIVFCTFKGLAFLNLKTYEFSCFEPLTVGPIRDIGFWGEDFFFSYDGGVVLARGKAVFPLEIWNPISSERVLMMSDDLLVDQENDLLWVATESRGVYNFKLSQLNRLWELKAGEYREKYLEEGPSTHYSVWNDQLSDESRYLIDNPDVRKHEWLKITERYRYSKHPDIWHPIKIYRVSPDSVFVQTTEDLYVITGGGIVKVRDKSLPDSRVTYFTVDQLDTRHFFVDNSVFISWDRELMELSNDLLAKAGVPKISMVDRQKAIWIGTMSGSLVKISFPSINLTTKCSVSDYQLDIIAYAEDEDGNLYMGTREGIFHLDGEQQDWIVQSEKHFRDLKSFLFDRTGSIVFCTSDRVYHYNNYTKNIKSLTGYLTPSNNKEYLVNDLNGITWINNGGNIFKWDGKDLEILETDGYPFTWTNCFTSLPDSSIMIADWMGPLVIKGNKYIRYHQNGLLHTDNLSDIFSTDSLLSGAGFKGIERGSLLNAFSATCAGTDENGVLWTGTFSSGIIRLDGDSMAVFDERNGLPTNRYTRYYRGPDGNSYFIYDKGYVQIVDDKVQPFEFELPNDPIITDMIIDETRQLIFATSHGLYIQSEEEFLSLQTGNGLQKSYITDLIDLNGEQILAIQPNAYFTVKTSAFRETKSSESHPIITRIESGEELYPLSDITIAPKNHDLKINFALPDYLNESQNRYSYRVTGLMDEFSPYSTLGFAAIQRIPHGLYTFELRAKNAVGQEYEIERPISLNFMPYFYETTFFKGLMILLLVGVTFLVVHIRINTIKRKNRELDAQVQLRTKELEDALLRLEKSKEMEIETEKLRAIREIAVTIAHEFNNPLAIIRGTYDILEPRLENTMDAESKKFFDKIPKTVDRMVDLVQQLLSSTYYDKKNYAEGIEIIDLKNGEENDIDETQNGLQDSDDNFQPNPN